MRDDIIHVECRENNTNLDNLTIGHLKKIALFVTTLKYGFQYDKMHLIDAHADNENNCHDILDDSVFTADQLTFLGACSTIVILKPPLYST